MVDGLDFCDLKKLLSAATPPYFLVAEGSSHDVGGILRKITYDLNWSIDYRKVNGKRMCSLDGIFYEFSAAYQFPEYFGHNWAALDECINDLDWINANSFVLILMNFDTMFTKSNLANVKILVKILFNTCLNWKNGSEDGFQKRNTPFHIIFHTNTNSDTINDQIFKPIGVDFFIINIADCMRTYKLASPC